MPFPCHHPPIPKKPGSNWIEKLPAGLDHLPEEAECVARALFWDRGKPPEVAYRMAIGKTEDWASGKDKVHPDVRARSAAAVAKWEAMRAASRSRTAAKKLSEALQERGFEGERLKAALDFATVSDVTYQTPIAGFSLGDKVMFKTGQGIAHGRVKALHTSGVLRGDGPQTVRASESEPVARVELHRKGRPTGVHIARKVNALRKVPLKMAMFSEELEKRGFADEKLEAALQFAFGREDWRLSPSI